MRKNVKYLKQIEWFNGNLSKIKKEKYIKNSRSLSSRLILLPYTLYAGSHKFLLNLGASFIFIFVSVIVVLCYE